jgi:hypothetical protein
VSVAKECNLHHHHEYLPKSKIGLLEGKVREDEVRKLNVICVGIKKCLRLQQNQMKWQLKHVLLYH